MKGIEPSNKGATILCLTTWRHPPLRYLIIALTILRSASQIEKNVSIEIPELISSQLVPYLKEITAPLLSVPSVADR